MNHDENQDQSSTATEPMPDVLTAEQVAAYLQLRVSTVGDMARRGEIPSFKIGRHRRFDRDTITDWIANRSNTNPYRR